MSHRLTYAERRRARLARRAGALERLEERNMITESLGIMMLGIGTPAAIVGRRDAGDSAEIHAGAREGIVPTTREIPPLRISIPQASPGGGAMGTASASARSGKASVDWLTLIPNSDDADQAGASLAARPAIGATQPPAGGGGVRPPRGGSNGPFLGQIHPFQVGSTAVPSANTSAVSFASNGPSRTSSAAVTPAATRARSSGGTVAVVASPVTASQAAAETPATATAAPLAAVSPSGDSSLSMADTAARSDFADSSPDATLGNASLASLDSFTYFPMYVLDNNDGTVLFPGAYQYAYGGGGQTSGTGGVDLIAQVRDTDVLSYSWDTSGLTDAHGITGTSTPELKFNWGGWSSGRTTNSVTLTVTNTSYESESETYTFEFDPSDLNASVSNLVNSFTSASWPAALAPDTELSDAPSFASHNMSVDAGSGALDTRIALPSYNPNVPAPALTYDSLAADPRPIVVGHHTLDPALATPSQVSAQLTFDGTAGTTYYYDTSAFIPGDVQQLALQADATGLSTGRYAYTLTTGDIRGGTTTTSTSGSAIVLNDAGSPFGAGWGLEGLERITPASGGVILDLGGGGKVLWFSGSFGSGGGTFTDPAGEFSVLTQNSDGTYTRTETDGSKIDFDTSGREVATIDTNGLRVTYSYDSGGRLSTIEDPYANLTTFSYNGSGELATITDPAGRVATFTESGGDLTGVALPDSSSWSYGYDSGGRLTHVTDPNSHTVTVAYDAAERVATITRPDATVETFSSDQEAGWTNSGTAGSPAPATLLAEAGASYTDPLGHTTELRPDWGGMGMTISATDPDGNVATQDLNANGLPIVAIDRLNRITQYAYNSQGDMVTLAYPDLNLSGPSAVLYEENYTYNSFSEPTSHTDPNGNTTSYTYDGDGNLTVVEDALGNRSTMTYTGDGMVATVKDARTNVTSYQYDGQDRLTTITYPDGSTSLTAYDSEGNATTITDERGDVTVTHHDAMNRPTSEIDALGDRTTYVYDAAGNVTAVEAPLSRSTSYAYDTMDRLTTVTDPLGHATVTAYDSGGNAATVTDPLGRVTSYAHDAEDRPTVVTDPRGGATTATYDAEGQTLTVTDPLGRTTTSTYSLRGWVATVTDPLGTTSTYSYTATGKTGRIVSAQNGFVDTSSNYNYDALDRLTSEVDALSGTTSFAFDAVGNKIAMTDPNGNTASYAYDSRDRLTTVTDALGHASVYGYDSGGNQVTVKDPLGDVTTTVYDALNRATTVTDPLGNQTVTDYDAGGRQSVVIDPLGNRTTYGYDVADRLTTVTTPIGTATYVYDADGELVDETDADGRRTTFAYDSGGNQTEERWLTASGGTVRTITYTYDADSELTGAADPDATLTFTYDSGGNQVSAETSSGAGQPDVTLTSGYDDLHDRTSLHDNLSSTGLTTYSYDVLQRLTTITRSLGGTAGPQVVFGYDAGSRLKSLSRTIAGTGTQVNTTIVYDQANRVTTITDGADTRDFFTMTWTDTPLATYAYGYDNANRVSSEKNAEGTVTYTYDADGELMGSGGSRAETYTYDSGGNRTMSGYSTGTNNEQTASPGETYTYDAEGNMTGKTDTVSGDVWTYNYDNRNHMTGVMEKDSGGTTLFQGTYTYDPLGRRIGTDVNGTQTWMVWDGQNPYAQFTGSGSLQERYLFGSAVDEILARTNGSGTTSWYLTDKNGSVRDITTISGSVLDHMVHDSFGNLLSESNPSNGDQFRFDGMQYDTATGLYYDAARYYDPVNGRFMRTDPKSFAAGDPNLFRFVGNGPTNATDPSGLDMWGSIGGLVGGGIVGGVVGGVAGTACTGTPLGTTIGAGLGTGAGAAVGMNAGSGEDGFLNGLAAGAGAAFPMVFGAAIIAFTAVEVVAAASGTWAYYYYTSGSSVSTISATSTQNIVNTTRTGTSAPATWTVNATLRGNAPLPIPPAKDTIPIAGDLTTKTVWIGPGGNSTGHAGVRVGAGLEPGPTTTTGSILVSPVSNPKGITVINGGGFGNPPIPPDEAEAAQQAMEAWHGGPLHWVNWFDPWDGPDLTPPHPNPGGG